MIPKIVHYVWVGPAPFPEDAAERVEAWRRMLPDYEFMFWHEGTIDFTPRFVRQAYGVGAYNRVANYVRFAVLEQFGGVYMDHDVELLKSFDLLLGDGFFAGFQTWDTTVVDVVNTAILGSEPGHPLARRMLAALDARNGADEVGSGTGPGLLSRVLREDGPLAPQETPFDFHGVKLYPPRYFYPYEWFDEFDPACVTSDTVTIHHWAALWKKPRSPAAKIQHKLGRLITRISPTASTAYARAANLRRRSLAAS